MVNPCKTEVSQEVINEFQWLLALLRAQYLSYQESHWTSTGPNYYGQHLLFQRLYESVQGEVDGFAEKMIGLCSGAAIDSAALLRKVMYWMGRWNAEPDLVQRGLLSEDDFQTVTENLFDALEDEGILPLGLNDMLAAMANSHDTHQYLLGQVAAG